jgi:hypothetical protein
MVRDSSSVAVAATWSPAPIPPCGDEVRGGVLLRAAFTVTYRGLIRVEDAETFRFLPR